MKITTASYQTGCYGEPTQTLTISRQGDAVVAVIGAKVFRFRGVELCECPSPSTGETNDEIRRLCEAIYVFKGKPSFTHSMLCEVRDLLVSFA